MNTNQLTVLFIASDEILPQFLGCFFCRNAQCWVRHSLNWKVCFWLFMLQTHTGCVCHYFSKLSSSLTFHAWWWPLSFLLLFLFYFRRHLEQITGVGPRPVGSQENEVLTVGYLLEQIEDIRARTAAGPHQVTVDVQRPTGSFSIDFLGGFTSFYDRVTNIAVKLEPKRGAQHLMLANCHFDTVANSPGTNSLAGLFSFQNWWETHIGTIRHASKNTRLLLSVKRLTGASLPIPLKPDLLRTVVV